MIHYIVSCRQIDKSGSCDHVPLIVILYMHSACVFFDEVSFNNWGYMYLNINISYSFYMCHSSDIGL